MIHNIVCKIETIYKNIFIENNSNESKIILDHLPNDIKLVELINYNLDRKNELKKLLIEHVSEDDVKKKLYKLYEKRIKLIQYLSQNDFI